MDYKLEPPIDWSAEFANGMLDNMTTDEKVREAKLLGILDNEATNTTTEDGEEQLYWHYYEKHKYGEEI
jgi:hypothetical protein